MDKYDCTEDVWAHIFQVQYVLARFVKKIKDRIVRHDLSKLREPEKSMFDEFTPKLKEFEFGSDEYKQALVDMGPALQHHYAVNRHHPEHFENGIDDMTLVDLAEMISDWIAAAKAKQQPVDLDYLSRRFYITEQVLSIIKNTIDEEYEYGTKLEAE